MSEAARQQENNRSSLFDKLPPDLRRQLDFAIVHRTPPTFQDLWMQFELAKYGVSFSALYRYARRLRDRINIAEAVMLSDDEDPDTDAAIQKLLSRRLLELLLHTGGADCTKEIAALTSAHRKVAKTAFDDRRLAESTRLANVRLELDRDHLRLKTEFLQSARHVRALPEDAKPLRLACRDDPDAAARATTQSETENTVPVTAGAVAQVE